MCYQREQYTVRNRKVFYRLANNRLFSEKTQKSRTRNFERNIPFKSRTKIPMLT